MNFTGMYRQRNGEVIDIDAVGQNDYDRMGNHLVYPDLDLMERVTPGQDELIAKKDALATRGSA